MNDIFYKELTAPLSCRGFVLEDPDGDFTVFVNRDLSPEQKERTIEHELSHIRHGDLELRRLVPAQTIESKRK